MTDKSLRQRLRDAEKELAFRRVAELADKRAISESIKASRLFREGKANVVRHGKSKARAHIKDDRKSGEAYLVWSRVKAAELTSSSITGVFIPGFSSSVKQEQGFKR